MLKSGNPKKWRIALILYVLFIMTVIVLAYLGIVPTELRYIPHYDTLGHIILLGTLSFLLHKTLNKRRLRIFILVPLAPIIISIFAIGEEYLQLLSPHRAFSYSDILASLAGIWSILLFDIQHGNDNCSQDSKNMVE